MARVKLFIAVDAECRQNRVEFGGRGKNDIGLVWFNTDAGMGGGGTYNGADLTVRAVVHGENRYLKKALRKTCRNCSYVWNDKQRYEANKPALKVCPGCESIRQGVSTLHAEFTIEMPEGANKGHTVRIRAANAALADLARMGGMLVAVKSMMLETSPDPSEVEQARYLMEESTKILAELQSELGDYGNVLVDTPMGALQLNYLIACAQLVEAQQQFNRDNEYSDN